MSSFQTNISTLGNTASFYDWFNQYNNEVLTKLNNAKLARPLAGDGITFTSASDGGYTFELSGTLSKNMVFNGSVLFAGTVDLATVNLSALSVGVSGNFISAGVTAGKVVRVTNSGGLTLAIADGASNAEALGIAIEVGTTKTVVAVGGKISGNQIANNLISGGFTSGCVYFLDPTVAGGITRTEPTLVGHVSKPVILGLSTTEAVILPYRGQLLGGSGSSGDNLFNSAIFITVRATGESEANFKLRPGTVIASEQNYSGSDPHHYSSTIFPNGYFKATSTTPLEKIIGFVSEYVGSYSASSDVTLKVNTSGSVITSITSYSGWSSLESGVIYLTDNGTFTNVKPAVNIISVGNVSDGDLVLNIDSPSQVGSSSVVVSGDSFQNILINGSLSLWQRGTTFGVTHNYPLFYCNGCSLSTYNPFPGVTHNYKPYCADRWVLFGATGENGFTATRGTFLANQTDVLGYPKYYVSLIKNTTVESKRSYFYNIIENYDNTIFPVQVNGKQLIFSFYARTPGGTGSFAVSSLRFNRTVGYTGGTTHATFITTNSNWNRYGVTFIGPSVGTIAPNQYFFLGIGLQENGKTFEFAQFMLEEGATASQPKYVTPEDEYPRAARYYQRSYHPGVPTMTNTVPDPTVQIDGYGNFGEIHRGILQPISVRASLHHTMKYPMLQKPAMVIFSLKGQPNMISIKDPTQPDGYNAYGWKDSSDSGLSGLPCIRVSDSSCYGPCSRTITTPYISTINSSSTDFYFITYSSTCTHDLIGFHYIADADSIIYRFFGSPF